MAADTRQYCNERSKIKVWKVIIVSLFSHWRATGIFLCEVKQYIKIAYVRSHKVMWGFWLQFTDVGVVIGRVELFHPDPTLIARPQGKVSKCSPHCNQDQAWAFVIQLSSVKRYSLMNKGIVSAYWNLLITPKTPHSTIKPCTDLLCSSNASPDVWVCCWLICATSG